MNIANIFSPKLLNILVTTKLYICFEQVLPNPINEKFQSQEGDYIDWHHDDLILKVRVNNGEMGTVNRYYKGRLLNKSDAEVISIEPVIGNDTLN